MIKNKLFVFIVFALIVICLTACQIKGTTYPTDNILQNENVYMQMSAYQNDEYFDELSYYQEMFDGQFWVTNILKLSEDHVVLAAYTGEMLLVIDFDITQDSAIIAFEEPLISDAEGEIKTITQTEAGYALVTNKRILLIDKNFKAVREIPLIKSFGETVSSVSVNPNGKELVYCDYEGLHLSAIDFSNDKLLVKSNRSTNILEDSAVCSSVWSQGANTISYSICDREWVLQKGTVNKDGTGNKLEQIVRLGDKNITA